MVLPEEIYVPWQEKKQLACASFEMTWEGIAVWGGKLDAALRMICERDRLWYQLTVI